MSADVNGALEELSEGIRELEVKIVLGNPARQKTIRAYVKKETGEICYGMNDYLKSLETGSIKDINVEMGIRQDPIETLERYYKDLQCLAEVAQNVEKIRMILDLSKILGMPDVEIQKNKFENLEAAAAKYLNATSISEKIELTKRYVQNQAHFYFTIDEAVKEIANSKEINCDKVMDNPLLLDEARKKALPTRKKAEEYYDKTKGEIFSRINFQCTPKIYPFDDAYSQKSRKEQDKIRREWQSMVLRDMSSAINTAFDNHLNKMLNRIYHS